MNLPPLDNLCKVKTKRKSKGFDWSDSAGLRYRPPKRLLLSMGGCAGKSRTVITVKQARKGRECVTMYIRQIGTLVLS